MTVGLVKTQGTELYFRHYLQSDPTLVKVDCPTGVQGLGGGAASQIPTTCLDTRGDETQVTGLGSPSPVTASINFIPSSAAHQALMALKASGVEVDWILLFSDGTDAPTLDTDGEIVAPGSPLRTSAQWAGAVSEFSIDVATNEIVRASLSILRSGSVTWNWNGPTPT